MLRSRKSAVVVVRQMTRKLNGIMGVGGKNKELKRGGVRAGAGRGKRSFRLKEMPCSGKRGQARGVQCPKPANHSARLRSTGRASSKVSRQPSSVCTACMYILL